MIYMLGSGVAKAAPDFDNPKGLSLNSVYKWIYGIETQQTETDDSEDGTGTCRASAAVGQYHGVVVNSRLIIVKHSSTISSFLDAILQMVLDAEKRSGNKVTVITAGFIPATGPNQFVDQNAEHLRSLLNRLLKRQVVVVAAAGENEEAYEPLQVRTVPAKWSTDSELNIITVGSVNARPDQGGAAASFSPIGDAITVSAPGDVVCATKNPNQMSRLTGWNPRVVPKVGGTGAAAAMTGGLAAYFLSLKDLGLVISGQYPHIPKAVKDVITYFAYSRNAGNPLAIANGVAEWDFAKIKRDLWKLWGFRLDEFV